MEERSKEQRVECEKPPSIDSAYQNESLKQLWILTNVDDKADLPLIYPKLGGSTKQYLVSHIVQDMVTAAREMNIMSPILPVCAAEIFKTLFFQGVNLNDLNKGLLSMSITPPDVISAQA